MMKVLLFAYFIHIHLLHFTHGWSAVTSSPLEEPEGGLMTLEDVYNRQDEFRLNDVEVGLTALKDKKFASCFVNDYDPLWLPGPSDKTHIIKNQPCDKVNKNTDFPTLKKKAGPKIAGMCKDLYVFWLAARHMGPPPLPGTFPKENSRLCPYDDDLPIPLTTELLDGEHVPGGKSELHELPPPMLIAGTPTVLKESTALVPGDGRPPLIYGAPPKINDGAPPMINDGAPPMINEGAPPMTHDGAPPMIHDGAPPMIHDGAPPMMQNSNSQMSPDLAPPMFDNSAPPMSREGAPPMRRDGLPPILYEGAPTMIDDRVPPMIGEIQPPLAKNFHSRRDLDAPTKLKSNPPSLAALLKRVNIIAPPTPDMKTPPPPLRL